MPILVGLLSLLLGIAGLTRSYRLHCMGITYNDLSLRNEAQAIFSESVLFVMLGFIYFFEWNPQHPYTYSLMFLSIIFVVKIGRTVKAVYTLKNTERLFNSIINQSNKTKKSR